MYNEPGSNSPRLRSVKNVIWELDSEKVKWSDRSEMKWCESKGKWILLTKILSFWQELFCTKLTSSEKIEAAVPILTNNPNFLSSGKKKKKHKKLRKKLISPSSPWYSGTDGGGAMI